MNKRLLLIFLASVFVINVYAAPVEPARNKDGSLVNGVLEAAFDPISALSSGNIELVPIPWNFFYPQSGPIDLTLALPVEDPNNPTDPLVALSAVDGWSTTEKWTTRFFGSVIGPPVSGRTGPPGEIDPASVVPGQSVRMFEVTTTGYPYLGVTGVVRELTPGVDFTAVVADGGVLAIVPLLPLKEMTTHMAVLTNDIRDTNGNDATPSATYHLTKSRTPWVDENGQSTYPLIPDESAPTLEGLRRITLSMELAAASAGVNPDDIVLSWTAQTQSITPTLKALRSIAEPAPTIIAPTGQTTALLGGPGIADIYIGVITVPYYSSAPSEENPIAFLTNWWKAPPGGYIPPFDMAGLDPNSTNLTRVNPFPVQTGVQTVPFILTVPNALSGFIKPENGWPVAIYQHGLTRNRTDMLAIADAAAGVGRVLISMDQPLHGVVPGEMDQPALEVFYVENTPFAPIANERTFDIDIVNNDTFEAGPDGRIDAAGTHSFNLANLQVARDNIRQAEADLSVLALSIQNMDLDGDTEPDLNPFGVSAVSNSAGSVVMNVTAAIEPIITNLYLNASLVGIINVLDSGDFGPSRLHPLLERFGLIRGTPEYDLFLFLVQTMLDPADSASWAAQTAARIPVIHNQVQGDTTVPNVIPKAPLSGGEALNRIMQLQSYSTTQANPDGLQGVARFVQPADHESLFKPIYPEVTVEMQTQMASFFAADGTFVQVGDPSLLVPAAAAAASKAADEKNKAKPVKSKNLLKPGKPAKNLGVNDHD